LYADAGLQVVYVILGFVGWYWWLKGGHKKSKLNVGHISLLESLILAVAGIVASIGFVRLLTNIHDIAPFWDGITTVSSLIAQYMLTRKYLENWYVWIATDVVYIGLYGFKHLALTAVLYVIFLMMCIVGVRDWKRQSRVTGDIVNIEGREA
jgi:nicotinamide mononucleotide transporter